MQENVERYYDQDPANEWSRLERHRMEYALTMRALSRHLPPQSRILDVGGGPGRYSLALAGAGHRVTLLDLSQANLAFARQKAAEESVQLDEYVHGNALDLSAFSDHSFDAVLLMGPLYHLLKAEERELAVREALRVLRPGGLLAATVITRFASLKEMAVKEPERLVEALPVMRSFLETGVLAQVADDRFTDRYCMHPFDLAPFMEAFGLSTREVVAQEGLLFLAEERVNQLTGPAWDAWVELNERVARDPSTWGQAAHLLYLGQSS